MHGIVVNDVCFCGPAVKVYVSVTSQCSCVDVNVWFCGLCLVPLTSALDVSVRITSQCSHSGSRFPDYLSSPLSYV